MHIIKLAAFSHNNQGGNPAGVVLTEQLPSDDEMQRTALEVGFSETAFAAMQEDQYHWRVRYFSPESEVPFCGHATIALGAALAKKNGDGRYRLSLNDAEISVDGQTSGSTYQAALQSPGTRSYYLQDSEIDQTLSLFGYDRAQLSASMPPAFIHAGADHYLFALNTRADLSAMNYKLDAGRDFMRAKNLVTVMFVVSETAQLFHARNAFASGGVLEDPATGAAAAAFAGYLRDLEWPHNGEITIIQGEEMGSRSLISADIGCTKGSSIRVSGATRDLI